MLIGLISDTHIPQVTEKLPPQVMETFRGVELILHAGDIYDVSVLDELQRIAPVLAARGDDDFGMYGDARVELVHDLTIEGLTLRLTHISYSWMIESNYYSIRPELKKSPDIVVSGHTHASLLERRNGTLLVSPGSATFPNYENRLGSVGLLTISAGKAHAQIIQLGADKPSAR